MQRGKEESGLSFLVCSTFGSFLPLHPQMKTVKAATHFLDPREPPAVVADDLVHALIHVFHRRLNKVFKDGP